MKFNIFPKKEHDAEILRSKVTKESINAALNKRSVELESLNKYDRGEKKITPRNLRTAVQSV